MDLVIDYDDERMVLTPKNWSGRTMVGKEPYVVEYDDVRDPEFKKGRAIKPTQVNFTHKGKKIRIPFYATKDEGAGEFHDWIAARQGRDSDPEPSSVEIEVARPEFTEAAVIDRSAEENRRRKAEMAARVDRHVSSKPEVVPTRKFNGEFEGLKIKGDRLHKGLGRSWPIAECAAVVDQGANISSRMTATRVVGGAVLLGPLGAILGGLAKKDRSKVFLAIDVPGDAILIEVKGKHEGKARKFALQVNQAAAYHRV